jgi:hypothetical protein
MQKDEEFIALLKSTVKENRLDIIPDSDLLKICTRARSIAAFSNTLDIELSKAINTLLEEIKKRGLHEDSKTQDTSPSTGTKSCPFCAEEINEKAIKCRHCGSMLDDNAMSQKKSDGLSAQTIQQMSFQTQFTLISNEHILIDGMSAYMKTSDGGGPHTFALRDGLSGYAYLTNYRLVFCSNAMNSTVAKVFAGGAVGAIARQVFKATKINFQVPISEISSVTKGKEGFSKLLVNTKYKFSTKSGKTYSLALPKGDNWMNMIGTLGVKCIV